MNKILTEASNGNLPDSMLVNLKTPTGGKSNAKLNIQASSDFNRMVDAAAKDGVNITVSQGYRSLGSQEEGCGGGFTQWCAWKKYKSGTGNLAAKPGTSNHGWGSAIDVQNCRRGSKVHKWLSNNAQNFGFYPLASESWHWDHKSSASSLKGGTEISPTPETEPTNTTSTSDNGDVKTKTSTDLRNLFSNGSSPTSDTVSSNSDLGPLAMLIPVLQGMGFGSTSQIVKSLENGVIPKNAIDKAVDKTEEKNNLGLSTGKVSEYRTKFKNELNKLKTQYGITISDSNIQKELDMEGGWREDLGENSEAKKQINLLIKDAKKRFSKLSSKSIVSGYRSYDDQVANFGNKAKSRGVDDTQKANTLPGFSQHHTGKAFDIFSVDTGWWNSNNDVKEWVRNNASKYGFKVTYTEEGKLRIPEPWHLYYVGNATIRESTKEIQLESQINKMKKIMIG